MSKITVAVCDRCDRRLDKETHSVVRVSRGDTVRNFDLCPEHQHELLKFMGVKVKEKLPDPLVRAQELAEELMVGVRQTANKALERFAEGANVDELAQALRDVSSAARR